MSPTRPTPCRISRLALLTTSLVACAFALPALAHLEEPAVPISADSIVIDTVAQAYEFHVTGEPGITLGVHSPAAVPTSILIYGTGASAGSTGLLRLDQTKWSAIADGFQYSDPGSPVGIDGITLKEGELHVIGSHASWRWDPAGPQTQLWFHFSVEDEWVCALFEAGSATAVSNEAGHLEWTDAAAPPACPEAVCGNAIRELPEVCDDGNLTEGDGCSNDCSDTFCDAPELASTFAGIQDVIFGDGLTRGCSIGGCHSGASAQISGMLDLSPGVSYDNLFNVPSFNPAAEQALRVEPGEPIASFLYDKLAAGTFGGETAGSPMPVGLPLPPEYLEAIERWIRAGAPEDLVVEGTSGLLGACLPEPDPLKLTPPEPPDPAIGFQLRSTAWPLEAATPTQAGEDEICFATYYDLSALVPASARIQCSAVGNPPRPNPGGVCLNDAAECSQCVFYNRRVLRQDAQSHHSIINIYRGEQGVTEPGPPGSEDRQWGPWTYKPNYPGEPGAPSGPCDPFDIDPAKGYNPDCSGVIVSGAACTGHGPIGSDQQVQGLSGSQEPYSDESFAAGVYQFMPMVGVVVWNSHAFNLTSQATTMAQYLDIEYILDKADRKFRARGIFDIGSIYIQQVPPFETREYCRTNTLPIDTNLFELGSHTHRWGEHFRIWLPPNEPCDPGGAFGALSCANEPGGCQCGPRMDEPVYESFTYTDPVQMIFEPPIHLGESVNDRTLLFCSEYDNGSTPTSPTVKRQSTSPYPPPFEIGGVPLELGGPCPDEDDFVYAFPDSPNPIPLHPRAGVACLEGPNQGLACGHLDEAAVADFCESEPGLGDGAGRCDACEVLGGFTTEDEMFILLGSYYVPEPSSALLTAAALATVGLLAGRRRRRV